jgi:N-acetylmuramoyl-L-alanine amidase
MGEELIQKITEIESQSCSSEFEKKILELYYSFQDSWLQDDEILLIESLLKMREIGSIQISTWVQSELLALGIETESITSCSLEREEEQQQDIVSIYNISGITSEHIEDAKEALWVALDRVLRNRRFRAITGYSQNDAAVLIEKYFPLMIKESHLDPLAVSSSGAIWYFQLKPEAITDATDFIENRMNVRNTNYNVNHPEDNCVLWIVYYELLTDIIKTTEWLLDDDRDKFTQFTYNLWIGNFEKMREVYFSENPDITLLSWDIFASWCSQKVGAEGVFVERMDSVYGGKYRDWFGWEDYSQVETLVFESPEIRAKKIFEAVNYVEKIANISIFTLENPPPIPSAEMTQENVPFHYEEIELISGSSITNILRQKSIDIWFASEVFDFNKSYNPLFEDILSASQIPLGTKVYIPVSDSWFYTSQESIQEYIETGSFDFQKWIESIEVIGADLEWKVFVLDPGHGWPDLWAHPIARDGQWNPISDPQSAVRYISEWNTQRVTPWSWSDYLHVYESLVTVDVAYRLAFLLRQQWAMVHITRYNRNTWIIENANMTTPEVSDDIYSDTRRAWEYSRDGNNLRLERGAEIARNIYEAFIENGWDPEDISFFSIHADSRDGDTRLPINFLYYSGNQWTSEQWRSFAEWLASYTAFRDMESIVNGQWLKIINPSFNPIPQSVLVELGNMNDPGTAYVLRQPGTDEIRGRQQFAEALYQWIIANLQSD